MQLDQGSFFAFVGCGLMGGISHRDPQVISDGRYDMSQQSKTFEPEEKQDRDVSPPHAAERVGRYFGNPKNYLDIRRYIIEIRKETVQEFIRGQNFSRVLDIGCGDGSISVPLLTLENRLTLLDISPEMLSRARQRVSSDLINNVEFINQDLMTAPLETGSYDLIICIGVLAHVRTPATVIAKIASLLAPGGMLILECTDAAHFSNHVFVFIAKMRSLFQPVGYRTCPISAQFVIGTANQQGLNLASVYRHNLALPTMRRFLTQSTLHKMVRWVFGTVEQNRNVWLGKECLFLFTRSSSSGK
jgi:2-polyprenyl-3-methyl-5-hydroxy-6-metoxy-1,4-benzoquinol methylase